MQLGLVICAVSEWLAVAGQPGCRLSHYVHQLSRVSRTVRSFRLPSGAQSRPALVSAMRGARQSWRRWSHLLVQSEAAALRKLAEKLQQLSVRLSSRPALMRSWLFLGQNWGEMNTFNDRDRAEHRMALLVPKLAGCWRRLTLSPARLSELRLTT